MTAALEAEDIGTRQFRQHDASPRLPPAPLTLTNKSRLADSSTSLSIVSAMAWSTASSWEVKCWIVVFASDNAKVIHYAATAAILPFRQAGDRASPDCLKFAHKRRIAGERRGPGARLEQFSVFADMHGIDLIGLRCAPASSAQKSRI